MTQKIGILIIEDDLSLALQIEMMIVDLGYKFLGNPRSSTEALEAIAREKPDLIITDINIKGEIDGVTLIENIGLKNTPVIYITGFEDQAHFNRAKKTPHSAYLIKPFHLLSLRSAIEKSTLNLQKKSTPKKEQKTLFVKNNNLLRKIPLEEILWIEVEGNYCYLFTKEKKHVLKISLKKVLLSINQQNNFLRIHRNYVVRKNQIKNFNINTNTIKLHDKDIPVGRKYKPQVIFLLRNMFS